MTGAGWFWDQHTCLPLIPAADLTLLESYVRPGGGLVSVNVGYSPQTGEDTRALLTAFHRGVLEHPDLALVLDVDDLANAREAGQVAVVFDVEDCAPLDGDVAGIWPLVAAGVRALAPTYNYANAAGSGCLDTDDTGLTAWGADLVREMNTAGMVVDGSHCSERTGLDLSDTTTRPMIYSHSCLRSVWEHPRNITDDQARACAATGGVVGITGVGIFLGPNTPTLEAMARHLEAAVELIGIDHVGVSTDFSFDRNDFDDEIRTNPQLFDDSYTRWGPIQWMPPKEFLTLDGALRLRGWNDDYITAVTSGNFHRVATSAW